MKHHLVILAIHDPKSGLPDKEIDGRFEFDEAKDAELRALLWLHYCPNDLVMLVPIEHTTCKWCGKPIQQKEGWVLHEWVHEGGSYGCWPFTGKQAEPE